jgi:L-lysine exporter family protein LysE/ArgO
MTPFLAGFSLGISLIIAIGAQNAFVFRQGLRRAHVFAVSLTCAGSDALLIAAGVAGFGWIAEAFPWVAPVLRYGGATFLIVYGAMAARAAWRGGSALVTEGSETQSLATALGTCLALTWLNPHVYLDTLVLIGSVASQYDNRWAFGLGAITGSFVFFFSLGYGARALAPLFAKPAAWRILDVGIAALMWSIAGTLILT